MAGSEDLAWIDYKTSQQSQASCIGKHDSLFQLGHCFCTDLLCPGLGVNDAQKCGFCFFVFLWTVLAVYICLFYILLEGRNKTKENPSDLRLMHSTLYHYVHPSPVCS